MGGLIAWRTSRPLTRGTEACPLHGTTCRTTSRESSNSTYREGAFSWRTWCCRPLRLSSRSASEETGCGCSGFPSPRSFLWGYSWRISARFFPRGAFFHLPECRPACDIRPFPPGTHVPPRGRRTPRQRPHLLRHSAGAHRLLGHTATGSDRHPSLPRRPARRPAGSATSPAASSTPPSGMPPSL